MPACGGRRDAPSVMRRYPPPMDLFNDTKGATDGTAHGIRVGIGGWTYAPWRDNFYPKGLVQRREARPADWAPIADLTLRAAE